MQHFSQNYTQKIIQVKFTSKVKFTLIVVLLIHLLLLSLKQKVQLDEEMAKTMKKVRFVKKKIEKVRFVMHQFF